MTQSEKLQSAAAAVEAAAAAARVAALVALYHAGSLLGAPDLLARVRPDLRATTGVVR